MRAHGLLVPQRRIPRGEHNGRIETSRSDEVWATDLSKIATREGWLWIVGVIDCHDRDLIGHRYGVSADTTMCLAALGDAVWERFPDRLAELKAAGPQLSHDWGSQFTSRRYQAELSTLGITSRPTMIGSPEQNGIMERFFEKHERRGGLDHRVRHPPAGDRGARRLDRGLPHPATPPVTWLPNPRRVQRRSPRLNLCTKRSLKRHLPTGPLHPAPPPRIFPRGKQRAALRPRSAAKRRQRAAHTLALFEFQGKR